MAKKKAKKVLVIEDDKFLRKAYNFKLQQEGYEVIIAIDGEEALKIVLHDKPDIALLDIVMPGMNGFEFLEAVRANKEIKDLKVIILSNLSQESDKKRGEELKALAYVVKSNTKIQEVIDLIEKNIGK